MEEKRIELSDQEEKHEGIDIMEIFRSLTEEEETARVLRYRLDVDEEDLDDTKTRSIEEVASIMGKTVEEVNELLASVEYKFETVGRISDK